MFKNLVQLTLRNLFANPLFSLINILGLAIGLACVILIALFVQHETSFDKHWVSADRTYKVMRTFTPTNGSPNLYLATNAPLTGPLLKQDFSEFEQVVRIMNAGQLVFNREDSNQRQYEDGLLFADPDLYKVFDIPLLQGDWETALAAPFQMVISESMANRYFEDGQALGEVLIVANQAPVTVTGVMQDITENTHLGAQGFVSMATVEVMLGEAAVTSWGRNNFHTYVVVPPNYNIQTFIDAIPAFISRHIGENANDFTYFEVLPLTDIHLNSQRDNEIQANGSVVTVYTFSAIAVFILLIACFNFMNLSTAKSASRAREVGLRKTLGAERSQIIAQFLGESLFLILVATVLAFGLVALVLPWFNNLIGLNLQLSIADNPMLAGLLLALICGVGLAAGSYPAFFLSSFSPSSVLKGELTRGKGGVGLRKVLVVVQFSISIGLVVASGIALSQLRYALTMDPGFAREQVLTYRGGSLEGLGSNYQTMKQELLRHPEIVSVTAANLMPGDQNTNAEGVRYEGSVDNFVGLPYLNVDYDFFETFGITMLTGRSFSEERGTDLFVDPDESNPRTTATFILNEVAARQIGFSAEEALDKWFEVARGGGAEPFTARGPIIGVASNIYFSSIREAVKPIFYRVMPHDNPNSSTPNLGRMAVRVTGSNLAETMEFIATTWSNFLPAVPIQQQFMDQKLANLYQAEQRQSQIFTVFSIMAIVIAGLGLFGLASYLTEQRTKEIGVRKVLGGSMLDIVRLLTWDFSKLVLLANVIAWPVAWYFMNGWLQNFAYRTSMGIGIFIFAAILAWLVAVLTVGSLAAITASVNPVLSLRHE